MTGEKDFDMAERRFLRLRLCLTALATFAELAHLAWQHLHGGIASHHILDRADLPAISNGWSGLVIPCWPGSSSGAFTGGWRAASPCRRGRIFAPR